MSLQTFLELVKLESKRGDRISDDLYLSKIRQAVRWIERQHTFRHMEHYATFTIDPNEAQPRAVAVPTGLKKVVFMNTLLGDDPLNLVRSPIIQLAAQDINRVNSDRPRGYWQDGMDYFWFDCIPAEEYSCEIGYVGHTVIGSNLATSYYVLEEFEALCLSQTITQMGPILRDKDLLLLYKDQRDSEMKAAIDEDVEARQSNQSIWMEYGWEEQQLENETL